MASKNKSSNYAIPKEDLLLYLLSRIEPRESTKLKLNKLAFFAEFGYKYKTGQNLTNAEYAGITHGPVINNYRDLLSQMEKNKLIKTDERFVFLHNNSPTNIPSNITQIIDPIIDKYARLSTSELRALSHQTDSYLIATEGEKKFGRLINKDLAALETFFDPDLDEEITEKDLPILNKDKIVPYAVNFRNY